MCAFLKEIQCFKDDSNNFSPIPTTQEKCGLIGGKAYFLTVWQNDGFIKQQINQFHHNETAKRSSNS